jgi:glycosyltransferase involved in cell wall biosynthesis
MIPTYNCASYLRETLRSVLAQDPGPEIMQIEVVDDCSTLDDPAAVVAELGGGRVAFYQQIQNVGHCLNFNTCLQRARGQLVHLLHGDDCVRDGFYAKMQRVLADNPAVGTAFCRYISMDARGSWVTIAPLEQLEDGILPGWLEKIATGQRLQTPCMVVRREVYETLDGFDNRLAYHEDWEMWVRIASRRAVAYMTEPLALYRVHATSAMARGLRTGENGRDLRLAISIIEPYLPPQRAHAITKLARGNFSLACLRRGHRMLGTASASAVPSQIREALKTDMSFGVIVRAVYLGLRWLWQALRRAVLRENGSWAA